jgi:phosphopentomutase
MTAPAWKRIVLITLDGVGVGGQPDAAAYGDAEASTLPHVAKRCGGLRLPTMERLGLGHIVAVPGVTAAAEPCGAFGRMLERSVGKDTTTGHWEMAGLVQGEPFATFPNGFPEEIIEAFTLRTGLRPLGNIAASGTGILRQLGAEHLRTGRPIVYTSVDSVFQIAAHEEVIPVQRLYEICAETRRLLDAYRVGRVIARPFIGTAPDNFQRTARRRDFSMPPGGPTLLDRLQKDGLSVCGIGKIGDIFAGRGLSEAIKTVSNADGMTKTRQALEGMEAGLVFTNLVDFDMLYGHRQDALGFGRALEEFDDWLEGFLPVLQGEDLLIISADHGCDPTTPGTDHTRESVPLLAWHPGMTGGVRLGVRQTFADVAATIGELLAVAGLPGTSFAPELVG